ncbi:MAG: hypothetical protein K5682_05030 [Lachnospiraceae bacterium]|nr:hypothetical protein [Lachnospiraceae bacterium]
MIDHLMDLADRSREQNRYLFSEFLSLPEQSDFLKMIGPHSAIPYEMWGGIEGCERKVVRFGSPEELGYEEDYPIVCLEIAPRMQKFADHLEHRDVLGALMNQGIRREVLGDIFFEENVAYLFCLSSIAEYLQDTLKQIRHTAIQVRVCENVPDLSGGKPKEKETTVASERIDVMIAECYNLSRSVCSELFHQGRVFLNGRQTEQTSAQLKAEDLVTVRGFGRFRYKENLGMTKKGKIRVVIELWGN